MVRMDERPAPEQADQDEIGGGARTTQAGWRVRLLNILMTADTPRRTAAAFAFGVFLSFSPFIGFQIAIGLGTAFVLGWSRVAVFAGLCTNLPWIMVPWYTFTTLAGAALLGVHVREDIGGAIRGLLDLAVYRIEFWTRALEILAPFFWSFLIGSTAGAIVVGAATYVVVARTLATVRVAGGPPA
jgi:uncharacterized protein (DUF2062 family)